MKKSIATLLLILVIYGYGLGQLGGYFVSSVVRGQSYLYAAIPLMNVASWAAVDLSVVLVSVWYLRRRFDVRAGDGAFGRYYMVLAAVALAAVPIGMLHDWPVIGTVADAVYLIGGCVIYFVALAALRADRAYGARQGGLLRHWIYASLFWAVASTVCYFTGTTNGALGAHFPSVLIVTALYCVAFQTAWVEVAILTAPLVLHLKEMNRTTLVQFALAAAQFAFAGGGTRMLIRSLPILAIGSVVAVAALPEVAKMVDLTDSPLGQRLSQLSGISMNSRNSEEVAVSQRFYEAEAVLEEYKEASLLTWLFGFGAGATFDMKNSRDDSVRAGSILGENRVHNIHFLPVAFFFRHGLLGLSLIAYFGAVAVANFLDVARRTRAGLTGGFELIAAVFIVQALIEGIAAASHFVTNPAVALFAAYSDHVRAVRGIPPLFGGRRSRPALQTIGLGRVA
jgi:hypothetical protein